MGAADGEARVGAEWVPLIFKLAGLAVLWLFDGPHGFSCHRADSSTTRIRRVSWA